MDIDNLSVSLKTNGAADAIQQIKDMATAVDNLAKNVSQVDSDRLESFANGLRQIRTAIPTANQATNMTTFATAVGTFTNAISGANITQVANDMSNLSSAVQGMGTRSANTLNNAAQAMQNFAQQTRNAAQNANNNVAPNPANNMPRVNQLQNIQVVAQQVTEELNRTAIAANSIGGRLQRIGAIVPTNRFRSLAEQLENVRRRYDELRERMNQALASGQTTPDSAEFQRWSRQLEALRNDYDHLIERQRALALEGRGFQLNPSLQKGLEGFKSGFSGVINVVKGGFSSAIKSANRHLSSFVKNLMGANSAQKTMQKTLDSLKSLPDKIAKGITRIGKMLKLMVTRMALRAVIKEVGNGFKSLAIHSDQFNESMSDIINASKQLGYSFASMVSPLINAFAPAIVTVINLLTDLINKINQVLSALAGFSSWNRAIKFTDSWRDSIQDAGKSGSKAAKELKKTVLAFDELNQLQENKNSGGGSGSDIKDMFETVEVDPKWKKFAEDLKKMWDAGDFTKLGEKIGQDFKKLLDSIPWNEIERTAEKLGTSLASLINGFIKVEGLGYTIGNTIAQALNTIFSFVYGFVTKLDWDAVGKFIADTFNGFFENINWKLIKNTIVTGLTGIADAVNSFVNNFRWDNISETIINGVDTVVSGVYAFFKRINWKKLGEELGGQLRKTIEGINWKDVGKALGSILQAVVDFVANFVSQLKVSDIRKALKDMVDGFFDEVDTEELGKTLADIIDIVIQVAAGFWEDNKDRLWEEGKKLVKGMFSNLDDDTKSSIESAIKTVLEIAVLAGITKAGVSILASAVVTGFKNMVLRALFGGAGGAAAGGTVTAGASTAGAAVGLAYAGALVGEVNNQLNRVDLFKNVVVKLSEALGIESKAVDTVKESYSGLDGTMRLLRDGIKTGWYALTGQKDKLDELYGSTKLLTDETGNATKTVDTFGNTIIDVQHKIEDITKTEEGQIKVYDDSRKAMDDYSKAMEDGASRMIDIKVKTDDYGRTVSEVSETILPKLGEKSYLAASAQDSINLAIEDYKKKLDEVKNHQTIYKTHLDVIRDATAENVKKTEEARGSFERIKDETGKVTLVLKDNKPAYEKAGDAAKDASKKVADYVGTSKDEIKIVSESTKALGDNKPALDKVGESAKTASSKLDGYKGATKDVLVLLPEMKDDVNDVTASLDDIQRETENATSTMKESFSKESWTFDGIAEGLEASFKVAFAVVKGKFSSFIDDINSKLHINVKGEEIDIGRVGYATGGFPEDGFFFANHNELVGSFSNGKTAVANNEQITRGIESATYNAMMSALSQQQTSSGYISNEIIVDGEVIARSVSKAQEKRARRYSPQTV